mmetsp:Transcript_25163/g.32555  ORF Transcript_25163/g.32555 Transcript_25163/m.32555 type:complete len:97 (-) Transcript_25163:31-321(-)
MSMESGTLMAPLCKTNWKKRFFQGNLTTYFCSENSQTYEIDIRRFIQKNIKYGTKRKIRRQADLMAPNWQWEDEHGKWNTYGSFVQDKLEKKIFPR